jgi:hypothetical protein
MIKFVCKAMPVEGVTVILPATGGRLIYIL